MLDRKFCSVCGIEIPAECIKTSYCSDECRQIGKDTSKLRFKTAKKIKGRNSCIQKINRAAQSQGLSYGKYMLLKKKGEKKC